MNKPLISLVMPLRHAAPFLPAMLESLRVQTLNQWELLMVLDRADAETSHQARQAARRDERLQVLENRGRGIIQALETGRRNALGWALGRLDGDDKLPKERLAQMLAALQKAARKTIISGPVRYFSASGTVSPGYRRYEAWLNTNLRRPQPWQQVYRECLLASPNWLLRRRELAQAGGFRGLQYPEDYDLLFRWYRLGFKLQSLEEVSLYWREHPERTSRHSPHYQQGSFFRLKVTRFTQLDRNPQKVLYLLGAGQKGKWAARVLKARGVAFQWLDRHPYQASGAHRKVQDRTLLPVDALEAGGQILVAVYPPRAQRAALNAFLEEKGYREGFDYWYI